jgi:GTP-dependent phosphoenolpyruvate carboxykinase
MLDGLSISRDTLDDLLRVDSSAWIEEDQAIAKFFGKFGDHLPAAICQEQKALTARLNRTSVALP